MASYYVLKPLRCLKWVVALIHYFPGWLGGSPGGWLSKLKIRLNSASVEVEVEVEAELGNL